MAYTYVWTPSAVKPDINSVVTIKTWDGKNVPTASFTVSGFSVRLVVPEANRYHITIRTKALSESAKLDIPKKSGSNSIEQRLKNYTDQKVEESYGGSETPGGLIPDPDLEGFFKIVNN